jgi:hypothetical protein
VPKQQIEPPIKQKLKPLAYSHREGKSANAMADYLVNLRLPHIDYLVALILVSCQPFLVTSLVALPFL